MQTEQLRALLLEYLKSVSERSGHGQRENLQYSYCIRGVTGLAQQRCPDQLVRAAEGHCEMKEEDGSRLKHVIWDLILERVLIPSTRSPNSLNDGWPFLSLTDHGRKVVVESKPVPYDPDGYLSRLDAATGGLLHPSVKRYLEEAISTFRTGNYLASAVMLGAASEMLSLELCSAISGAIDPTQRSEFHEKTAPRKKMVDRLAAVTKWLTQKKSQLPPEWQRQEQVRLIEKIADLIRTVRNDAGHPQDPPAVPLHEEMYALLVVFPHYCEKVYELKKWLVQNPGAIT